MKKFAGSLGIVVAASLAACGGGGGINTTSFSGKVIDGYIKNAKVCLDLNENLKCDDGPGQVEEKYTTLSGPNGSYSFSYTGGRDVSTLHIIAEATEESIDEDDGKTFKDAGRNPVTLLTPAPAPQAITPLTTVVSNQQIAAKEEGKTLSLTDAEKQAQTLLNMTSVSLVKNDYKDTSKGSTDVAQVAKAMTLALADTQKAIKDNQSFKDAVASSGKSLEAEAIKQAVAVVKTEIGKNITDGKLTSTDTKNFSDIRASTAQVVAGQIEDIVKVTAVSSSTSSVWNPLAALKAGLYFLSIDNSNWFGDGKTPEIAVRQTGWAPNFSGAKVSEDGKSMTDATYEWSIRNGDNKYSRTYKWPDNYYLIEGKGWVKDPDSGGDITIDGNCVKIAGKVSSEEACGKAVALSGKTVKEAGFCSTADKNTYFKTCSQPDLVFPSDTFSYSFSLTALKDKYKIWSVENGPGIPFSYKQEGNVITVTAATGFKHQTCQDCDITLDFTSGNAKDGRFKVVSLLNDTSFTVQASDSQSTSGDAVQYWGGWGSSSTTDLLPFVQERIKNYAFFNLEDCEVQGQFIESKDSASGYAIKWSKGTRGSNGCTVDTSAAAKKYEQTTALVFESVYGNPIMRSVAPDAYKLANDDYYGVEILWALAKNPAGVTNVYNGEIRRASVKREIISGLRQAIGNRAFVDTINKAWGYPALPTDTDLFAK